MGLAGQPEGPTVLFQLLGPLEIHVADKQISIASSRQRIVLGVLLMSRNHVVTIGMLMDAVWDGAPPSSARSQIQICISALRRAIGVPGLIETTPDGYRIRVQPEQLDCDVFDTSLANARAAMARDDLKTALEHFDAALGLWRGPALAGVPGRAAEALANRLEERRVMAIEDRIETRLGLGAHRELAEELVALTSKYSLRERLWGLRMVALYRSGRQAEALAAYQEARRALIDELGLEPGEFLIRLEHAILSHDSSLDFVDSGERSRLSRISEPPHQLPADISYFVGHTKAVDGLIEALVTDKDSEAASGSAKVAVITGPAGCGKTTVALHAAHLARGQFFDGQLFASLHGSSANPTPTMEAIPPFLRALGMAPDALPASAEEQIALLRTHLAARRVLIVLDDVADEQQIFDLLPGTGNSAVLITSRNRFTAPPGTHIVELGALSETDSIELLKGVAGKNRLSTEEARSLARLCGGLPIALRIAGTRLTARPHWPASTLIERLADERSRLDELSQGGTGVRQLLTLAFGSLSAPAQRLVCLLSVLECPDFSPLVAAAALDCGMTEAVQILDELADAWLLSATPVNGQMIRYSFPELSRIFAREQVLQNRNEDYRQSLERVFGCLLAVARGAHRRVYGGDFTLLRGRSLHWVGAEPYVDPLLRDPMAWFEAERSCLRAAVHKAADLGLDEYCWELAVVSTTFYENRGLFDEWRSTHVTALQSVRSAGNRRGEGAVLISLGSPALGQHSDYTEKMLLDALGLFEAIGDDLGQALSLRALAHRDRMQGYPERSAERYERALAGFRAVGDRAAHAHALSGLARAYLDMGELERAEILAKDSLRLCQDLRSRRLQAQALHRLGEVLLARAQPLAAKAVFHESLNLARHEGDRIGEVYALNGLGSAALEMDDLGSAEINYTKAIDLSETVRDQSIQAHVLFGVAQIYDRRSEPVIAEQYYLQSANLFATQRNASWHSRAMDAVREAREAAEILPSTQHE